MATTVGNILRLSHAGIVLAQHGVRFVPAGTKAPFALHLRARADAADPGADLASAHRPAEGASRCGGAGEPGP